MKLVWDTFVRQAKNSTFLLERDFMEYHKDRFTDCSIVVVDTGGETTDIQLKDVLAVLPANWVEEEKAVYSHQGLTYGGLVLSSRSTQVEVLDVFSAVTSYYRNELGAEKFIYKPIPYIYNIMPSDEYRYALWQMGASLRACTVSSTVQLSGRPGMRILRERGVKKAEREGLEVALLTNISKDENRNVVSLTRLAAFWDILTDVLTTRHGVKPVHSLDEMKLLWQRFPQNITPYVVLKEDKVVAGCVVFESPKVAHIQYISANDEGRCFGALDLLFATLMEAQYADKSYLDFGVSTEEGGRVLNKGLIFQKEGFGARSVCYETWEISLK